jgi:hypothetical protein
MESANVDAHEKMFYTSLQRVARRSQFTVDDVEVCETTLLHVIGEQFQRGERPAVGAEGVGVRVDPVRDAGYSRHGVDVTFRLRV